MYSRSPLSYQCLLKLMGFVLWTGGQLYAQCPSLKAIMVDPCGDDVRNEFLILDSGSGFNTQDLQISFDITGNGETRENNDININIDNYIGESRPCRFEPGDASLIQGCPNIRVVSQEEEIPPNAIVIIQTSSNADEIYDFSELCGNGECVYVLQNDCIRTKEAFTNHGSGSRSTLIAVGNTPCRQEYTYDRADLDDEDGAFYAPQGINVFGNRGCGVVPPIRGGTIPPEFVNPGNLFSCGSFVLPAVTGLNLTGGEGYFTGPYGTGVSYSPGTLIKRSTTLFIYDRTAPCSPLEMFRITIEDPIVPELDVPDPLCAQDTPYPLPTVQDGIRGHWTGDDVSNDLFSPDVENGGVYLLTFVPDPDECAEPNIMEIEVLPSPGSDAKLREAACNGNGSGLGVFDLTSLTTSLISGTNDRVVWYEDASLSRLIINPALYTSATKQIFAVIDNGVCQSKPVQVDLLVSSTPTVRFTTIKSLSCFGDTDGGIEIEITDGMPPYMIEWSDPTYNGQTTLTDLSAGPYGVTVTDSEGCSASQTVTLIEPPELILECDKLQDSGTIMGGDGVASFTASGGVAPYWLIWDGPEKDSTLISAENDTVTIDTLNAGTYEVRLRDALGCLAFCAVDIDGPTCDLEVSSTFTTPACFGDSNGSISITTTGAQGALTYTWNLSSLNGQAAPQNLPAGQYEVTVADEVGCMETLSFSLEDPPVLDLSCMVQNPVSVLGGSDGRARIQVAGGTRPYTATWTGPKSGNLSIGMPTEFMIDSLTAGTYELQLMDANNCLQSCSFTIEDGSCSSELDFSATNESCPDAANGSIQVNLTGNWLTPVTYDWDNDLYDGLSQLDNLPVGDYSVTVTGANGCQAGITATVGTDLNLPEVSFAPNATVCRDACYTYELTFSGSAPFFAEFILRNGNQSIPLNINSDQSTAALEICLSDYEITTDSLGLQLLRVSDANCINETLVESTINILQSTSFDYAPTICPNESVSINGQTYDIDRPMGTEILAGANRFGCDSIINIDLQFETEAIFELRDTICSTASISVNGQIYDIDRPSGMEVIPTAAGCDSLINIELSFFPTPTGRLEESLCPGEELIVNGTTYNEQRLSGTEIFPGAGSNGCDSVLEVSISYYEEAVGILNETICPDEEIVINGNTYNRDNPSGVELFPGATRHGCDSLLQIELSFFEVPTTVFRDTICPDGSLTINGTVYDSDRPSGMEVFPGAGENGCDSLVQVEISFFDLPVTLFRDTICPDGSLTVNGTVYDSDRPSGMEVFPGAGENGCDSLVQVELSFFDLPVTLFRDTICPDGSLTVNGTVYDSDRPSGMEVFPGAGENGCDSLVQVEISFFDLPVTLFRDTICPDGSLTINGTVYDINRPSGMEVFSGGGENGCDSLVQVELIFQQEVSVSLSGDQDICLGESATLEFQVFNALTPVDIEYAANGGEPVWIYGVENGDQITVSPAATTTYTILQALVPPDFCSVDIVGAATVRVSDIMVDAVIDSDYFGYGVSCEDQRDGALRAVVMSGTGPFEYLWQDGVRTPERTNLAAGVYSVMVTDALGCSAEALAQLEPPPPVRMELSTLPLDCDGGLSGAIIIDTIYGGNAPYFFSLDGAPAEGISQFPRIISGVSAGRHTVELSDEFGCGISQEVVIGEFTPLELILGPDQTIRYGESVRLDGVANFQIDSLIWTPSDSLSPPNSLPTLARPAQTTTYKLTAFDSRACSVSDEITVRVIRKDDIYLPNAFTPNGDGINDRFYPFTNPNIKIIDEFRIFDRWGEQMHYQTEFQGNLEAFGWDGKRNNQPMDPAVFIFLVKFTYLDGKKGMLKGDVTLVR